MNVDDLDYELPERLIAQYPPSARDGGRLLEVRPEGTWDSTIRDWADRVPSDALVVLNDTRVMHARLLGERESTGGGVELLVLGRPDVEGRFSALCKAKRPLTLGETILVSGERMQVVGETDGGARLFRAATDVDALLERVGHVPLPPYVRRQDEELDRDRYQTVFARELGSSAAPTAGLHLTPELLDSLRARGVTVETVTLHVGLGTFRPVSSERLEDHVMHHEHCVVSPQLVSAVQGARSRNGKVVAIGTTVVRALETAAKDGEVAPFEGSTNLLIAPGFRFRVVDALLTNFHAPRSTLLALVYAFAGRERVRAAYQAAIDREYRFLSYGDAMWLPTRCE